MVEPYEDWLMQIPWRPVMGLSVLLAAGCHSYHPYGYTGTGPYAAPPPTTYGPAPSVYAPAPATTYTNPVPPAYAQPGQRPPLRNNPTPVYPTQTYPAQPPGYGPQRGPTMAPPVTTNPSQGRGMTAAPKTVTTSPGAVSEQPVPRPVEPRPIPEGVGGGVLNEDADTIKGSNRSLEEADPPVGGGIPSDAEDAVETIGYDDDFRPPRSPIRRTSGVAEAPRRGRKSPFKRASDYSWISGTITQDPQTGDWQVTYDPDGNDEFGGVLTLVHDDALENFLEGDMIRVYGKIDQRANDRVGRPLYRPTPNRISRLVDREETIR